MFLHALNSFVWVRLRERTNKSNEKISNRSMRRVCDLRVNSKEVLSWWTDRRFLFLLSIVLRLFRVSRIALSKRNSFVQTPSEGNRSKRNLFVKLQLRHWFVTSLRTKFFEQEKSWNEKELSETTDHLSINSSSFVRQVMRAEKNNRIPFALRSVIDADCLLDWGSSSHETTTHRKQSLQLGRTSRLVFHHHLRENKSGGRRRISDTRSLELG